VFPALNPTTNRNDPITNHSRRSGECLTYWSFLKAIPNHASDLQRFSRYKPVTPVRGVFDSNTAAS
jgi:hypothetical protein